MKINIEALFFFFSPPKMHQNWDSRKMVRPVDDQGVGALRESKPTFFET